MLLYFKMDIIEVIWLDTCTEEADIPKSAVELVLPLVRRNIGYCLKEDEGKIVICSGVIENIYKNDDAYQYTTAIPRGTIKEIKRIKDG